MVLMGAAEVNEFAVWREVTASTSPQTCTDESLARPVCVHYEYLLIGIAGLSALVRKLCPLLVPIGLSILPPKGELADVNKVGLVRWCGAIKAIGGSKQERKHFSVGYLIGSCPRLRLSDNFDEGGLVS